MDKIQLFLIALGTSVISLAGLWQFIIKKAISNKFDIQLKEHEANLKRDYDIQVERLKAELAQQHFRFSQAFKTTEETIASLYEKLLNILDSLEDYTFLMQNPSGQEKTEKLKVLNSAFTEFYKIYRPKKIYLPKDTTDQINELMNTAIALLRRHSMGESMRHLAERSSSSAIQRNIERNDNEFEQLQKRIGPLLLILEGDFQKLLGFPIIENK